jgi:hypothetical protein
MTERHLLDEKVISQNGSLQRVRRWWKGVCTEKGTIIWGLTGWETVEETDRIVPRHTFIVEAARKAA